MPAQPPIRADLTAKGLAIDRAALANALAGLPDDAPVVALIHGYSFAPGFGLDCPHRHIFALDPDVPDAKAISWPRHLGLDGKRGLAIACGWQARGSLWRAHGTAARAGKALACLARMVAELAPQRRLQVIGHSLGARVALAALPHARPGDLPRLILLAGAEARGPALAAVNSPAGRQTQVLNVTTRENDLYDALFEWIIHAGFRTSIGQGLGRATPNWRDLWIDTPASLNALGRLGYPIAPAQGRVSHWSPYLRPGVFTVYRAILSGDLPLTALPDPRPARRWSRLLALPVVAKPV